MIEDLFEEQSTIDYINSIDDNISIQYSILSHNPYINPYIYSNQHYDISDESFFYKKVFSNCYFVKVKKDIFSLIYCAQLLKLFDSPYEMMIYDRKNLIDKKILIVNNITYLLELSNRLQIDDVIKTKIHNTLKLALSKIMQAKNIEIIKSNKI